MENKLPHNIIYAGIKIQSMLVKPIPKK